MLFVKAVESEDGGVIISKLNDDAKECSSVFVGAVAWNLLARYQHDAAKALEKGTLGSWILQKNSDESALMLTVSPYNNRNLVSIRIYANGQPTRQGITMGAVNFEYLRNFLPTSAEFVLGRAEYKSLVWQQVMEKQRKDCEGCRLECGGQRDHDCLKPPSNTSALLGCTGVDPYSFQLALATKALERKVILIRPSTVYKLLHYHYRDEIEKEVIAELLCAVPDDDNDDDDVKPMV